MAEHVSSRRIYFLVFAALAVLTVLTWGVAQFDLGPLNDVVALVIAVTKATLVILFFMHVAHSSRLTKLTVVASFFWLAILLGLTLSDYLSRPASNAFRAAPPAPVVGEAR
jgi:cytochrome c oxidase subunit IV